MENQIINSQAPSNIALIKYMGKTSHEDNLPTNSSISLTLKDLISVVEIQATEASVDSWQALNGESYFPIEMSEKGQQRFLSFFKKLKDEFGIRGNFVVRSANNFPSDCGIASSASSFAALTRATYKLALAQSCKLDLNDSQLSELSRTGSGSSCRSFFEPWSIWDQDGARAIDLPFDYSNLLHKVAVVSHDIKKVSSSEAHRRVVRSDLFEGRPERAQQRLENLIEALKSDQWHDAYQLCWQEFWDMHTLFETSKPHFGYMSGASIECLKFGREQWERHGSGAIITMDAGPNVHFIYKKTDQKLYDELLEFLEKKFG